jgi:hypothetical protein
MQELVPIITPVGVLNGRDAIYLNEITLPDCCNSLVAIGSINCRLASKPPDGVRFQSYRIKFSGVLAHQITELDTWEASRNQVWPPSSFDEVKKSEWIARCTTSLSKVTKNHRHFIFQTYDHVIEVLCLDYVMDLIINNKGNGK